MYGGTSISSNDTYADIYSSFFESYDEGKDVSVISKELIDRSEDIINDPHEKNNFWFTLANVQLECKC